MKFVFEYLPLINRNALFTLGLCLLASNVEYKRMRNKKKKCFFLQIMNSVEIELLFMQSYLLFSGRSTITVNLILARS